MASQSSFPHQCKAWDPLTYPSSCRLPPLTYHPYSTPLEVDLDHIPASGWMHMPNEGPAHSGSHLGWLSTKITREDGLDLLPSPPKDITTETLSRLLNHLFPFYSYNQISKSKEWPGLVTSRFLPPQRPQTYLQKLPSILESLISFLARGQGS